MKQAAGHDTCRGLIRFMQVPFMRFRDVRTGENKHTRTNTLVVLWSDLLLTMFEDIGVSFTGHRSKPS